MLMKVARGLILVFQCRNEIFCNYLNAVYIILSIITKLNVHEAASD